jgi:hypothetical protein
VEALLVGEQGALLVTLFSVGTCLLVLQVRNE